MTIVMRPLAQRLSTIESADARSSRALEASGFYDHMRDVERGINRGYFITPEDLAARNLNVITQMLEGYPSIRVDAMQGQPLRRDSRPGQMQNDCLSGATELSEGSTS